MYFRFKVSDSKLGSGGSCGLGLASMLGSGGSGRLGLSDVDEMDIKFCVYACIFIEVRYNSVLNTMHLIHTGVSAIHDIVGFLACYRHFFT